MEEAEEEVTVHLRTPVKYGKNDAETEFVTIKCPSFGDPEQRKYRRQLKALLAKVFLDLSERNTVDKNAGDEDTEDIAPEALVLLLAGSMGDKFADEIERFCKHCKGFVFLGGEEPLRDGPINRMNPEDIDLIFGTYISNFIMPSLMKSLTGKK